MRLRFLGGPSNLVIKFEVACVAGSAVFFALAKFKSLGCLGLALLEEILVVLFKQLLCAAGRAVRFCRREQCR